MKKSYRLLLLTAAIIFLAAGCRDRNGKGDVTPTPDVQVTMTPTPTAAPTAAPTATPIPTPTPEPTATPVPGVQEVFKKTEYSGVYKMDVEFEDRFTSCDVNMVGGTPVIVGTTNEFQTKIYAIDPVANTYRQILYNDYDNGYSFLRIDDEKFAVRNYDSTSISVYDTELNGLGTIKSWNDYENVRITDGGESVWFLNEGCLAMRNRAGEIVRKFDFNERQVGGYLEDYDDDRYLTVELFDFNDGMDGTIIYDVKEWKTLETDGLTNRFFVSPDGSETLLISTQDGLFGGLYDGGIEDCFVESLPKEGEDGGEEVKRLTRRHPKAELKLHGNGETFISFMDWENRVYITSASYYSSLNSVFELKAYSVDTGEIVAQYAVGMGNDYVYPALSIDLTRGLLFFTNGSSSNLALYCWDYMNDTEDDSDDAFSKMTAIPAYIEEKRRNFEEKYKIRLYLGSEVFASPFDYRLTICNDWNQVEDGIDTLDEVFGNYPDGFFDQIKVDEIKTLGIYICDGFEKIYSYSADDAIALACVFGYERALAIDMNYRYCLERTIVHEVSHWIDGKISSAKTFGKCKDYDEVWNTTLPDGYDYKYSYVSGRTVWKYIYYTADLENTYFCDEYSQTYPGEDRARCFEYLMYGEKDGYKYMDAPHIQEKLKLYFRYIREAFDDSTWPEKTTWEEKLDNYIENGYVEEDWSEDEYYGDDPYYGEWVG